MFTKKIILHTIVPLFIGFCVYLFFHKPNLLIHFYANKYFAFSNYYAAIKNNWFAIFMLNHVPDILWAYSFGIFLITILGFIQNKYSKAAFILVLVSFTEIMQIFYPKNFTFDLVDLFLIIITQLFIFFFYESKQKF
jgi:hypothetical protein